MTRVGGILAGWRRLVRTTTRRRRPTRAQLGWLLVVLAGGGLLAGGLSRVQLETGVDSFLPANDPAVSQFDKLSRSFGGDPVVVLLESAKSGQLTDRQQLRSLLKMEGQLSRLPDVAAVYGPATTLNQVAGRTQDLLAEMSGRRDAIRARAVADAQRRGAAPSAAAQAGDSATASFDRRYGSLLVQAMPSGLPTLSNQSFVDSMLYGSTGKPRDQWHFVLPSAKSVAILVRPREDIDQAATERLVDGVRATVDAAKLDTSRTTISGIPAIVSALGQEVRYQAPLVGLIALVAVGACFFFVPWNRRRRRLLPLASSLIAACATLAAFGWFNQPLSLGVVAFLPVLLGVGSDFATYLARRARRQVVLGVALATAASFAALTVSPMPFVRELGLALALGVLFAFLTALTLHRERREPETPPVGVVASSEAAAQPAGSRRPARAVVAVGVAVVAIAGWVVLPSLPVQSDFKSFAAGLPVLQDADHVEQTIGSSGEIDVVLRGEHMSSPRALDWMRRAQDAVISNHGDEVRPVLSLPTLLQFLGNSPTTGEIAAGMRLLPPYLTGAVAREDGNESVLSFGVTLDDAAQLQRLRDDIITALPAPPAGYEVELTGLPVVAARAYELVSGDRYLHSGIGIAAAGLVLVVVLARRRDALRAVVTASLATGVGLFGLWATGIPLTPVTVALGSLTAAVGCEFSVLLAESVRRRDRGLLRSVLLIAVVSAVGYAVLMFSPLAAIAQFGVALSAGMLLSLAIALVVLWVVPERPPTMEHDTNSRRASETMVGVTR